MWDALRAFWTAFAARLKTTLTAATPASAATALLGASLLGAVPALLRSLLAVLDDRETMGALGGALGALAPRLAPAHVGGGAGLAPAAEARLLAQHEATTHRPVSYASSATLPGTLNAPWWTDFAHLVYWFYVVATFCTVAFLGYLYDLFVRRRESAHPVRETRGFSRAQTGDLVTAVLPLTWSATMVMHASTHSINFDENTAGTAFSFTVIAYQWGWNYYFPRDVVAQLEAAPKVVGRGRVVTFAPTPMETGEAQALDLWAVRATLGSRHGSRTGRANTAPALALALPSDVPAGALAALPSGSGWRGAVAALAPEGAPRLPAAAAAPASSAETLTWGLDVTTTGLARPAAFVAGERLLLGAPHYGAGDLGAWAALAPAAGGGALGAPLSPALPTSAHLSGALALGRTRAAAAALATGLGGLRGATATAPTQAALWSGPDALTGAGLTTLASTEEMGWLTPVPAREATSRAALAARDAWASGLPAGGGRSLCPGPLLLPFDVGARALGAHHGLALPSGWVSASAALEAEISADAKALWAGSVIPALGGAALRAPQTLGAALPAALVGSLRRPFGPTLGGAFDLGASAEGGPLVGVARGAAPTLGGALRAQRGRGPSLTAPALAPAPLGWHGRAGVAHPTMARPLRAPRGLGAEAALPRAHVGPSSAGVGLDEARLVRSAAGRLVDPALVAGKPDALTGPFTSLPKGPLHLIGLGWSASASVSAYPSFKMARGALMRRPMAGLRSAQPRYQGLPAPLQAPFLGKVGAPLGAPRLRLWGAGGAHVGLAATLDVSRLTWGQVWAFSGPAPTEDLDPAFINTRWTPETNTTRRSDHNSRYLVTWAPLGAALAHGGALAPTAGGPQARGGLGAGSVRTSLLALNEAGLKNTYGRLDAVAHLGALEGGVGAATWPRLWALRPAFGAGAAAYVGQPAHADWTAGRGAGLLSASAGARGHGALSPALGDVTRGSSLVGLIAAMDLVEATGPDRLPGSSQGYLPLSSSISASRRLRVTKGIALPSDVPMHIICGSKDVIHSWAIPGLGVKIDCIPGYNSHRRLLLRWRGAYWGQCMEVCGRYHHWMPIMVNVVHPALFADWCLTFLRGLDTQAHSGSVGPTPAEVRALLGALGA